MFNSPVMRRAGCISVIIPIWREIEQLPALLDRLRILPEVSEIIVSGTKSSSDFATRVEISGGVFLQNPRPNRGEQLNLGEQIATAEWLLFHHVDSELTAAHIKALAALTETDVIGGAFYRKFDERHPRLRWLEEFERWHSRSFGALYGDQSVFVRRNVFQRLAGFAPFPLMEDVEFSKRLRRAGKIMLLDPPIRSSPRRQIEQGAWRVSLRNLFFLIAYRCGVSPDRLHDWYYEDHRREFMERASLSDDCFAPASQQEYR